MYKVTFSQPFIVEATELPKLLQLAVAGNTKVIIEPCENTVAPVKERKPRGPNKAKEVPVEKPSLMGGSPAADAAPAADPVPEKVPGKRGRPAKSADAPAAPKPAAKPAATKPAVVADATVTRDGVQAQFAVLIDADYDAAVSVLDAFGAASFGLVKDEELPAFAAKLTELGY